MRMQISKAYPRASITGLRGVTGRDILPGRIACPGAGPGGLLSAPTRGAPHHDTGHGEVACAREEALIPAWQAFPPAGAERP
jgi:hypothetical protein